LVLIMWRRFFYESGIESRPFPVPGLRLRSWLTPGSYACVFALVFWLSLWEGRWAGEPWIGRTDLIATENGVIFGRFPDRLKLHDEIVVGESRVEEVKKESDARDGEFVPTRDFVKRDLQYVELPGADLRGVALGATEDGDENEAQSANLRGAKLHHARLDRARLDHVNLQAADLTESGLVGAHLIGARLQGASLADAHLQGTRLDFAQLQGANLLYTQLQGAGLHFAALQGAQLTDANLRGADLYLAQLQGAELTYADLRGAHLYGAGLEGAKLNGAQLQGADLHFTRLQGADISGANMGDSNLDATFVFRTNIADANLATAMIRLVDASQVTVMDKGGIGPFSSADVDKWIAAATGGSDRENREPDIVERFVRLKMSFQEDSNEVKWSGMEEASLALDFDGAEHRRRLAKLLGDLACDGHDAPYIARGVMPEQVSILGIEVGPPSLGEQLDAFRARLEKGRNNPDQCPGVVGFTEDDWRRLESI
jgi:uncharacterized protein YjbI with pentapeptide repeats